MADSTLANVRQDFLLPDSEAENNLDTSHHCSSADSEAENNVSLSSDAEGGLQLLQEKKIMLTKEPGSGSQAGENFSADLVTFMKTNCSTSSEAPYSKVEIEAASKGQQAQLLAPVGALDDLEAAGDAAAVQDHFLVRAGLEASDGSGLGARRL